VEVTSVSLVLQLVQMVHLVETITVSLVLLLAELVTDSLAMLLAHLHVLTLQHV